MVMKLIKIRVNYVGVLINGPSPPPSCLVWIIAQQRIEFEFFRELREFRLFSHTNLEPQFMANGRCVLSLYLLTHIYFSLSFSFFYWFLSFTHFFLFFFVLGLSGVQVNIATTSLELLVGFLYYVNLFLLV